MTDKLYQMRVNDDVCIGVGQCEMLEEETFLIDDDTAVSVVIGSGSLPLDRAENVAEQCPGRAISFEPVSSD